MPYWLWNIRLNALAEENPFCSAICWMLRFSCRSCISICGIRYRPDKLPGGHAGHLVEALVQITLGYVGGFAQILPCTFSRMCSSRYSTHSCTTRSPLDTWAARRGAGRPSLRWRITSISRVSRSCSDKKLSGRTPLIQIQVLFQHDPQCRVDQAGIKRRVGALEQLAERRQAGGRGYFKYR